MKKDLGSLLALYPTPVTVIGAMNDDKPTYWTKTVVEHDGNDYYMVVYKGISLKGLTVRVRSNA